MSHRSFSRTSLSLLVTGLALPALAQGPLPKKDLAAKGPAYRLEITPPSPAEESSAIRVRPVATSAGERDLQGRTCTISVRPAGGGAGTSWQGAPDASCSRQDVVRLPAGAYTVRLVVAGTGAATRAQTQEVPYEVRPGDRVRLRPLSLEPARPESNVAAKVFWEVENVGPLPVAQLVVVLRSNGQVVERKTWAALSPGETRRDAFSFTPTTQTRMDFSVEADEGNRAGEPEAHRANNRASTAFDVAPGPPPTPVIVLGPILSSGRSNVWARDLTICNVDPHARYTSEFSGPRCKGGLPCSGPYSGVPADGDFRVGSFFQIGAALTPGCPGGLPFRGGLKPGALQGPVGIVNDHRFEFRVVAEKNGRRVPSRTEAFTVPANCRFPCVRTEGP